MTKRYQQCLGRDPVLGALTRPAQMQTKPFKPVTDEMLQNPDPADWINWRRTLDGWGYSPLNQINRSDVSGLQLAWSLALGPGETEPTPLVYGGTMYLPMPNGVTALDAATGEFIWEYKRQGAIAKRNVAIYADKVILNTRDAHIIALDARTGKVAWDTTLADPAKKNYGFSSGAIIAKGKILSGMTSCGVYQDDTCYITAHDANTGKELWRTSTVARPGEPGGDTWAGLPLAFRAGSEPWIPGSYDPRTNLIYWGTAQPKPWTQAARGTDAASLYPNSTLALDADTGKIVWYFQHIPGESHDMDEVFESILVDDGGRQSVFRMGKIAVLWELERRTGKFLNAYDLGYQNLLNIDSKTGRATYRAGILPKIDESIEFCSGPGGFKNLWSMAYHPDTRAFYIPIKLSCQRSKFGAVPQVIGGGGNGPSDRGSLPHPASPNDLGEFLAMDSRTGKVLWRKRQSLPFDTAALTTGGGLAFIGDMNRYFSAFDVTNGEVLWKTRLPTAAEGSPITYAVADDSM